jgi:hypothetical protein
LILLFLYHHVEEDIKTRWGTWMEAIICVYFQFIKILIVGFEENDDIAIKKVRNRMAEEM